MARGKFLILKAYCLFSVGGQLAIYSTELDMNQYGFVHLAQQCCVVAHSYLRELINYKFFAYNLPTTF